MERKLLHVYRNTALGRETQLQSAWFCNRTGCSLEVYVPRHAQFLLYFEHSVATVSLDSSYLRDGASAVERVRDIAAELDCAVSFVEPRDFTAPTLPNLPSDYTFVACPRSMSERSSKLHLGHIGPRVREIVKTAPFPVLLPTPIYKPWHSITALFGGSENSVRALMRARRLSRDAGVPLSIFSWSDGKGRDGFERLLAPTGLLEEVERGDVEWVFAETETFVEGLFDISRDALLAVGAYGHGRVREALFGSKLEAIQGEIPNNLLVVGPLAAGSAA